MKYILALSLLFGYQAQANFTYDSQFELSKKYMLENISPWGTKAGVVVAATSRSNPDYWFHWIRDAALIMQVVIDLYKLEQNPSEKNKLLSRVNDYIAFSYENQHTKTLSGLGEPKFYVDGRGYDEPWGRPQNDGPALRAITLIDFARTQSAQSQLLINVIKKDIEYTMSQWRQPSFDIWEEVKGQHFYTLMVQRRALYEASKFFTNKKEFSIKLAKNLNEIETVLRQHLTKPYIQTTLHQVEGLDYKISNADTANILALIHGKIDRPLITFNDVRAYKTVTYLKNYFSLLYDVNQLYSRMAPVIGRYPEDRYFGGNPWFLTTFAFAEYYYELASQTNNKSFIEEGDLYLNRGLLHKDNNSRMSEQISKVNGYMTSAENLTWSYSSYITAYWARQRAFNSIGISSSALHKN